MRRNPIFFALLAVLSVVAAGLGFAGIGPVELATLAVTVKTMGLSVANGAVVAGTTQAGQGGQAAAPAATAGVDANLFADAVMRAVDARLEALAPSQPAPAGGTPVDLVDPATVDARVIGDVLDPWTRDTVYLFNAMAAKAGDRTRDYDKWMGKLAESRANVTPEQVQAERREAVRILMDGLQMSRLEATRTMSTLTDAAGGYVVPTPVAAEIYVEIELHGIARKYSRGIPVVNKDLDLAGVATKPTMYWVAELGRYTASDPALNKSTLQPSKLTALTSWSDEQTMDEAVATLPLRLLLIGEGFAEQEDEAFFQGTGSSHGTTVGLLNLPSATTVTMSGGDTAHTNITAAYLKSMRDAVSLKRRKGAKYFFNPAIKSLLETIAAATAATDLPFFTRNQNGEIVRIWGHEFEETEDMPATAAAGESFVVFGAPDRYTLRGEKGGMQVTASKEGVISDGDGAVTLNALQQDATILKVSERVAFATPTALQAGFSILTTAAT